MPNENTLWSLSGTVAICKISLCKHPLRDLGFSIGILHCGGSYGGVSWYFMVFHKSWKGLVSNLCSNLDDLSDSLFSGYVVHHTFNHTHFITSWWFISESTVLSQLICCCWGFQCLCSSGQAPRRGQMQLGPCRDQMRRVMRVQMLKIRQYAQGSNQWKNVLQLGL